MVTVTCMLCSKSWHGWVWWNGTPRFTGMTLIFGPLEKTKIHSLCVEDMKDNINGDTVSKHGLWVKNTPIIWGQALSQLRCVEHLCNEHHTGFLIIITPNLRLFHFSKEKRSHVTFILIRTVPKYSGLLKTCKIKNKIYYTVFKGSSGFSGAAEVNPRQHLSNPRNHEPICVQWHQQRNLFFSPGSEKQSVHQASCRLHAQQGGRKDMPHSVSLPLLGMLPTGRAKFFRAEGCFCIYYRHLLVSWDLIWKRGPLGGYLRNRAWGRTGKDVVVCLIRKAIMKSGWRRGENSGSFLINPGSCWASSSSGMFRDVVCLNSLHLLMQ